MEAQAMTAPDKNIPVIANKTILVVGATSSVAQALCRNLAAKGQGLVLAARDAKELETLAGDLATRFSMSCRTVVADFMAPDFSPALMMEQTGNYDSAIIVAGDMGNGDNEDLYNISYITHLNYAMPAQIATLAAKYLSQKKQGSLVIISSVAGDRGRQSNYAYGSAKAALSTFASGLRNAFYRRGVHVMTVKPGFIDTPMTWGMESKLIASRESVANKIISAMQRKKDVVYVPGFWRWIMLIIRHIPERMFKRMAL